MVKYRPFCLLAVMLLANLFLINPLYAQSIISGKVSDPSGEGIPGVNIKVKNSTVGTITDFNGHYELGGVNKGNTIVYSFVGYTNKEVLIGSQTTVNVTLKTDVKELSEVVVVGYGTQEKVNVTGSVSQVGDEVLSAVPTPDAAGALQGRISGVQISSGSLMPGEMPTIRVRGVTTLGSANEPLVVIDGVPSSYENFGMLASSDIESISVLKDAASASIYGARAAAGVILVTTKKGTEGATKVSYEGYYGVQSMTRRPEYMDSYNWAVMNNRYSAYDGVRKIFTDEDLEKIKTQSDPYRFANTDWIKETYKSTTSQQSHYINMSGGTKDTKYFASVGYLDQDGFFRGLDNFKRYNAKLNVTTKLYNKFRVSGQMNFTRQERNSTEDMYRASQAFSTPGVVPARYEDGRYCVHYPGTGGFFENSLYYMDNSFRTTKRNTLQSFVSAEYKPIDELTITAKSSLNYSNYERNSFTNGIDFIRYDGNIQSNPVVSRGDEAWNNSLRMVNDLVANYSKTIGKHTFGAMAGVAEEFYRYDQISARRSAFANNELRELAAGSQAGQIGTTTAFDWALQSVFGRVNYAYDGKYLFEANLRSDISSRFAPENRVGYFPSVSLGWRVSEEPFFKNNVPSSAISDLKLRASIGTLGNQNVTGYYPYIPLIGGADYPFNNELALGKAQLAMTIPDITWETTTTYNAGMDIDFFDGKLGASLDVFRKVTDDILLQLPVSATAGMNNPFINAGQLVNNGWELDLRYNNQTDNGFKYGIGANVSQFKNELTELAGAYSEYSDKFRQGDAIGTIYGYRNAGLYRDQAEVDRDNAKRANHELNNGGVGQLNDVKLGDLKFEDINGDGIINYKDQVDIGNTLPKVTFGFNFDASYKNWDFSMFWQGVTDIEGYVGLSVYPGDGKTSLRDFMSDMYHPTANPNGAYPRMSVNGNSQNKNINDFWVQDASYLRLKNLQIGYSIPMKKYGVSKARVYVSGQNLLTFTKFDKGFDPERVAMMNDDGSFGAGGSNVRASFYPTVSVYSVGLQLTF
ncbi:TonB-dependent receptor [Persicobacter psychrovividus]|uniref:SusC/RagA family TonB-linked outer membrane protein n=1 Tax=Persicobacter psychrovividus TaxID=387638 RepID=A0ABN6LHZ4_9BACT|nr:SusC/RagA family TonB-linked outer membrane protein [Persicobacter psychrovividus]